MSCILLIMLSISSAQSQPLKPTDTQLNHFNEITMLLNYEPREQAEFELRRRSEYEQRGNRNYKQDVNTKYDALKAKAKQELERKMGKEFEERKKTEYARQNKAEYQLRNKTAYGLRNRTEYEVRKKTRAEQRKKAEYERRAKIELEKQKKAEYALKKKTEFERRKKAEYEKRKKTEMEQRKKAEYEKRLKAEYEQRKKTELEQQKKAQYEKRKKTEIERRKKAEYEKRKKAEYKQRENTDNEDIEERRKAEYKQQKKTEYEQRNKAEYEQQTKAEFEVEKTKKFALQKNTNFEQRKKAEYWRRNNTKYVVRDKTKYEVRANSKQKPSIYLGTVVNGKKWWEKFPRFNEDRLKFEYAPKGLNKSQKVSGRRAGGKMNAGERAKVKNVFSKKMPHQLFTRINKSEVILHKGNKWGWATRPKIVAQQPAFENIFKKINTPEFEQIREVEDYYLEEPNAIWEIEEVSRVLGRRGIAVKHRLFPLRDYIGLGVRAELSLDNENELEMSVSYRNLVKKQEPLAMVTNNVIFPRVYLTLRDRSRDTNVRNRGRGRNNWRNRNRDRDREREDGEWGEARRENEPEDIIGSATRRFRQQELDHINVRFLDLSIARSLSYVANDMMEIALHVEPPEVARSIYSYDGNLSWALRDYEKKKEMAVRELLLSCESPYFYTSPKGYRVQAGLFLNGYFSNGIVSVRVEFLAGRNDNRLNGSFPHRTTVAIVDPFQPSRNAIVKSGEFDIDQITYYYVDVGSQEEIEKLLFDDALYYKVSIRALPVL